MYCSLIKKVHSSVAFMLLCGCAAFVISDATFSSSSASAQDASDTTGPQDSKTSPWKQGEYPAFELHNLDGKRIKRRESLALIRFESEASLADWKIRHSLNMSFGYAFVPDDPDRETTGPKRGVIHFEGTGLDPYSTGPSLKSFHKTPGTFSGTILARLRLKTKDVSSMGLFWSENDSPGFSPLREASCRLIPDGLWRDYFIQLECKSDLNSFRLDPGQDVGYCELAEVEFLRLHYCPTDHCCVKISKNDVTATLRNNGLKSADWTIEFRHGKTVDKRDVHLLPSGEQAVSFDIVTREPFTSGLLTFIDRQDGTRFDRHIELFSPDKETDWKILRTGNIEFQFAPDAKGMRIVRDAQVIGAVYPLIEPESPARPILLDWNNMSGELVSILGDNLKFMPRQLNIELSRFVAGKEIVFRFAQRHKDQSGKRCNGHLRFSLEDNLLLFQVKSDLPVHMPVVRACGTMKQAVFPGVEYLEEGEFSSSTADIATSLHMRYAPDITWVTNPFMSVITDRGSFTLSWDTPELQPVFASPDFIDGTLNEHRMNLFGRQGSGRLDVAPVESLEDAILRTVKRRGLPQLPKRPRSAKAEEELILAAFEQSDLKTSQGWVHATDPWSPTSPFKPSYGCDFVSTIWELTGTMPQVPRLDFGGGHIRNESAFLVRCEGERLIKNLASHATALRKQMRPDGSFAYSGKYLRGHWSDTASGHCGNSLYQLMRFWKLTGDPDSLAAALKGLEFVNQLKTPRGAQVWELSLHTPDIMASSRCCMANIFAYEATGKEEYLQHARRWAITGLPFVYLWTKEFPPFENPVMLYASIAVFGATNWKNPNWMGLPVQWCGLDYAHALILLAPYDKTLDWIRIAQGILISATAQQYPDGMSIGLLPDSFVLSEQQRRSYNIHPCTIHMLQRMIDGKATGVNIQVSQDKRYHVMSPFKTTIVGDTAVIQGKAGTRYQVIINGKTFKTINSVGEDRVPLN